MAFGFLVPEGTYINYGLNDSSSSLFVNVPLNYSAVIFTMLKSRNTQGTRRGYDWSIEFYTGPDEIGAVWVYDSEKARDDDYERMLSTTFVG